MYYLCTMHTHTHTHTRVISVCVFPDKGAPPRSGRPNGKQNLLRISALWWIGLPPPPPRYLGKTFAYVTAAEQRLFQTTHDEARLEVTHALFLLLRAASSCFYLCCIQKTKMLRRSALHTYISADWWLSWQFFPLLLLSHCCCVVVYIYYLHSL